MTLLPITVVIPVRNEERNLSVCLNQLAAFKEVLVVDSASTDRTIAIAEAAEAKVIQFNWNGNYPKKRNWVLLNYEFTTPWVLFLDADERVNKAFVDEIGYLLTETAHVGFWISYRNHFLGRVLKHGLAQRKLALFKVGAGLYERIAESRWSQLDMEVHEHPVLDGPTGVIRASLDHFDFKGIYHFVDRHNEYSSWEAHRYMTLDQSDKSQEDLTARQKFKYRFLERWWYPPTYFCYTYFMRLGVLDGKAGLLYALFKMVYFIQIREKILELRRSIPR